ncbi:GTP pyrophosphokinase, partial [Lactiplantibacillus plantarum]
RDLEFNPKEIMTKDKVTAVAQKMHYGSEDDLFAALGFGDVQPVGIANRLTSDVRKQREANRQREREEAILADSTEAPAKKKSKDHHNEDQEKQDRKRQKVSSSGGVIIQGVDNLLVRLSHCCSPIPGDEIVGYITKGRGVSVHRVDCPNVKSAEANGERLIDVQWENPEGDRTNYNSDLEIQGYNRNGMLNDVLKVINNHTKFLTNVNGKVDHNKMVIISVSLGVRNLEHLQRIIDSLKNVQDLYVVERKMF